MHAAKATDLEHLAWARIALGVHDSDTATRDLFPELDQKILGARASDPATSSPHRLALAALALGGDATRSACGTARHAGANVDGKRRAAASGSPGLFGKIASKFRGLMVAGISKLKPLPLTSAVHIARAASYDAPLADILADTVRALPRRRAARGQARSCSSRTSSSTDRDKVINTDPRVVAAVIKLCKQEGAAEVIVAEGPGHWRNVAVPREARAASATCCEKHGVRFVDLNHDEPVKMLEPRPAHRPRVPLPVAHGRSTPTCSSRCRS